MKKTMKNMKSLSIHTLLVSLCIVYVVSQTRLYIQTLSARTFEKSDIISNRGNPLYIGQVIDLMKVMLFKTKKKKNKTTTTKKTITSFQSLHHHQLHEIIIFFLLSFPFCCFFFSSDLYVTSRSINSLSCMNTTSAIICKNWIIKI